MKSDIFTSQASPGVMPRQQAAHFCQLLINDGQGISPLSAHARRIMTPGDSLTAEQQLTVYIFQMRNWESLRIFPHLSADGSVCWYAPADELPASLHPEHQKYIHEVLPRLRQEMMAGHWESVDSCIDRMLCYQCQFGGTAQASQPSLFMIISIFLAISMLIVLCRSRLMGIWRR